jgi:hypothetical protein
MPDTFPLIAPALFVSVPTGCVTWIVMQYGGWAGLGFGLLAGLIVATICAIGVNLGGVRQGIKQWFESRHVDI